MSEPKLISPLLDGFIIGEPMSDHHGVCCCPALREDTGERYIVKIISIPASQVQLDALLLTGAFSAPEQALSYFEELAQGVLSEAETLGKLTRLEGFLPYTGAQVTQMDDGTGYQVYLLSPYKRSLRKHMQVSPLTHLGAINLSLDLCSALVSCRRAGYLYVDLKPSNIFLTQTQGWRIGDLGFMPLSSLKYASLPEKYRSVYTAPEITDAMSELSNTLDVYALGLVLYQVYNNGQLPFEEGAPITEFPPPLYADYELAEIILKACDPIPGKRWSDPAQMGQAIVAYMQRNCVNDTPIVPPPVETPQESLEEPEEEFLDEDENAAALAASLQELIEEHPPQEDSTTTEQTSVEDEELDFIIDSTVDETTPSSESAKDLPDSFVSQEVEEMLAQADELISHELPEPAVAPDPIEVPFPAPIILGDEAESSEDMEDTTAETTANDETSVAPADTKTVEADSNDENAEDPAQTAPVEAESENTEDNAIKEPSPTPAETIEVENADTITEADAEQEYQKDTSVKKSKARIWIISIIVALILAAAGYGAFYYYQNYYLQPVDQIVVEGGSDSLTLTIVSQIDDSLLRVVCTDTYGNSRISPVNNGTVHFSGLTPNTQYRFEVEISGLRRLIGVTYGSYTTAIQTDVLNFNARGGSEDGSVILSFSTNGPEPKNWTVDYVTQGEEQRTISFTGHSLTISGLTIGSEYTFTLGADETPLANKPEVNYVAQKILCAQELKLTSCSDGNLGISWTMPEWGIDTKWNVRCYNDAGFDQSISTEETFAEFTVPNYETGYTIEVIAEGMSISNSISVSANPIVVTNISQDVSADGTLNLTWEFSGAAPTTGWSISYSVDNTAPISIDSETNQVTIPYYPGSHYDVTLVPMGDVSYAGENYSFDLSEVPTFSQYGVTADDFSFYMCLTPERENWDRYDVPAEFYRTDYTVGEKASFLVEVWKDYERTDDEVYISYIIREADSTPVSHNTATMTWGEMWDDRFCELDIPQMPSLAGSYTIEIYFNGAHVITKEFNIT